MEERVRGFIINTLKDKMNLPIKVDSLADGMSMGQGGLDLESLAFVELTVHVENEFGVKFSDAEFEKIAQSTLGEFTREVARRAAAAGKS